MFTTEIINSFRGENNFLSNFYSAPVIYNGLSFQNNEAAFQAQKCVNEADREKFCSLNPSEARSLGRKIPLRKDWEQIKITIMREVVKAKFEQNPDIMEKLLNTGNAYLKEGNTWGDRTWGTANGVGANNLGKILMEVRELHRTLSQTQAVENQSDEIAMTYKRKGSEHPSLE